MNGQLQDIIAGLDEAGHRVRSLLAEVPGERWTRRPGDGRWSAAECLAHLNLASEAMLPVLRAALASAAGSAAPSRFRRDPFGWLVWKAMAPAGGLKTRTSPTFEPRVIDPPEALVADFMRLQAGLTACVADAHGRRIDRVTLRSPFDSRVTYNLYSALTLVPRHQHRHLRQAEEAVRSAALLASPAAVWSRA